MFSGPETEQDNERAILIVDDNRLNLQVLNDTLRKNNYTTVLAGDGTRAWELLVADPHRYSLVLLDRIMPEMDGMEVLDRMKAHPELKFLPVIMQTSACAEEQVSEGIAHGVYYYLTKPYATKVLLSLVTAAVRDYELLLSLKKDMKNNQVFIKSLNKAEFTFQSIEEGSKIANILAEVSLDPLLTAYGLTELIVNAVEHGNLEISYEEKGDLLLSDKWQDEINMRYQLPEYKNKVVNLLFEKEYGHDGALSLKITIEDQGKGFNWQEYIEISRERMFDTHGRGIAIAKDSFKNMEYHNDGTKVIVWYDAMI